MGRRFMSPEHSNKKLLAWLAEPWDLVFWPRNERANGRRQWRDAVLEMFDLTEDDTLLSAIEQKIHQLEGFGGIQDSAVDFCAQPTFIHPLSAEPITISEWEGLAGKHEEIRETALGLLRMVATSVEGPEDRFLALWRLAPELLRQHERSAGAPVKLGASWDLVPAFDFAPYATVWQRNAVAAALACALPKPGFLSFRMGGPQEFIDRARTTEDYWAGSYLISYLAWKAAEVLAAELGPDCVLFPALCGQPLVDLWLRGRACFQQGPLALTEPAKEERMIGSFPNGLLAIVPCDNVEEVKALARRVAEGFTAEWRRACDSVKNKLERALSLTDKGYWDKIWARQTPADRVFELFWTVTPWPDQAPYKELFSRASRDMETRKTLRDFRSEPEPNVKCHQCGLREALQDFEGFDPAGRQRKLWQNLAALGGNLEHRFRERERLCAVCTTRRLAVRVYFRAEHQELALRTSFPSTSSVAVTPYLRKVLQSASSAKNLHRALTEMGVPTLLESPFQRLEDELGPQPGATAQWLFLHIDGDWWFDETYDANRLRADFGNRFQGKETKINQARQQLREFLKALEQEGVGRPPNYFAVVVADGDRVGDWIRGDLLPKWSESLHPAARGRAPSERRPASLLTHLALSQCLGNLPHFVRPVIEREFDGSLVYTGGDDLLAFVPVARLAAGMRAYADAFSKSHEFDGSGFRLLPGKTLVLASPRSSYTTPIRSRALCKRRSPS